MGRSVGAVAILALTMACGGEPPKPKSPPYAPVEGRTTNPGHKFASEELGPPMTLPDGTRVSVAKRVCKEKYFERQLDEWREEGQAFYTVVREGDTNRGLGWYRRVVVTPEGDVLVQRHNSETSTDSWAGFDLKTYKATERRDIVHLLSDGDPLHGGRGDGMFLMLAPPSAKTLTAKSWDRSGKLVKAWDNVLGSEKTNKPMLRVGKLDVFFPASANGERMAQVLDEQHLPKGEPVGHFEEIEMRMLPDKGQSSGPLRSFLARPTAGDPSLYTLLLENGTFDTPPGLIGMRRLTTVSDRASESERRNDISSGVWLIAYETKAGKQWGWAAPDFSEQSGPIWSTVKMVDGAQLTTLYTGQAVQPDPRAPTLAYLVAEDAATKKWNAFLPRLPIRSFTKDGSPNESDAVAAAELACKASIEEQRKEAAAKVAASEAARKAAADRRIAGGATTDKDERWDTAMKYWRAGVGTPTETALQLGGVYLVDYVIDYKVTRIEVLERAVIEAKKFDPVAEQKVATMLKDARAAEAAHKKDRERRAAEQARASAPAYTERSTQLQWEPSHGTPTTYDIRTGVRSDTQALQNWTYGRQTYKPAY